MTYDSPTRSPSLLSSVAVSQANFSTPERRATLLGATLVLLLVARAGLAQSGTEPTAEATAEPAGGTPAYHLAEGSVASDRIVAVGRDLFIEGTAHRDAVVLGGGLRLTGDVKGDVIVVGGDAVLTSSARVGGDVFVLDGTLDLAQGAAIAGRSVAYAEASDLWVTLIQGPIIDLPSGDPVVLGAKLALLAFWAFLILLLMAISRRELVHTSESVREEPFRNFLLGMTGVAAMVLTALFFSALAGAMLGVPLLILLAVVALVLRFWGMVAVFHALGEWLALRLDRRQPGRLPLPLTSATYGLLALGVLKFVPWLGIWSWTVATFIGVGAALSTKLGRREPWIPV